MSAFDAEAILAELKGFQRDAVDHVIHRLYEASDAGRRFLVADETGLGKSVVARGVIARAIDRLEHDETVDRIDIVYVCSNADLAQQNLQRLNVTGNKHLAMTGRLTLLALQSRRLAGTRIDGKVVNLVSFTPGTSFDMGWRTGSGEERALLHVMLAEHLELEAPIERASRILFQGGVLTEQAFQRRIDWTRRQLDGPVHPPILRSFIDGATERGLIDSYRGLLDEILVTSAVAEGRGDAVRALTGKLRAELARASVETLEPDLVILDEFQRFRHLLDPENGGDAAELAHHLFDYRSAKVLLLSATPYKAYTAKASDTDDDHYSDFMTTLGFLCEGSSTRLVDVKREFAAYRDGVVAGQSGAEGAEDLRATLLTLMSRTERPQVERAALRERHITSAAPTTSDLVGFVALQRLATELDVPVSLEYWKSIPQFASFMDGYKIASALDKRLGADGDGVRALTAALGAVDGASTRAFAEVDAANGHHRTLAAEMIDSGMWKLLWLPPSMPYFTPDGPYSGISPDATKRLVFSAWTATPTAVASLLSYEVERRTAAGSRLTVNSAEARRSIAARLNWAMDGDRPGRMSTLAMFWPHPGCAAAGDPLAWARRDGFETIDAVAAAGALRGQLPDGAEATQAWEAFFSDPMAVPVGWTSARLAAALTARASDSDDIDEDHQDARLSAVLPAHVDLAILTAVSGAEESHPQLADLAMHSPGNIAYRALGRLRTTRDETTGDGLWAAAALLANGLRSLFNRVETTLLLDQLYGTEVPYWQVILRYCADGNLQAALDEYVFQLRSELASGAMDDAALLRVAERASGAITVRPSTYRARDLNGTVETIPFTGRFALRYGGKQQEQESARQPEIRNAFNSPFWPFVLASTSVGQEGIDFHWWSHAVLHWNLPSNPVDFEQREGRVNRFAGHAVRKNVAAAHRADVMASDDPDPWRAAFAAAAPAHPELGEFSPYWMYPGDSQVERQIITYPLSRDVEKLARLKDALTLYRLTLGQPRQQDMIEMMLRRGIDPDAVAKLDLRPPRRKGHTRT